MNSWIKKIPMSLTVSRMIAMPVIVYMLYLDPKIWGIPAALLFMAASATDHWDGFLARKLDAVTNMGRFMDPIGDKILVSGVLIMLVSISLVSPIIVIVLLCRDILIGGIRAVAATEQIVIDAKPFGKWKTGIQMIVIPALIVQQDLFGLPMADIGYWGLWLSVGLSLISGVDYFYGYLRGKV